MAALAAKDFRDGNALILGLVCQHRAGNHIADGIDAGHRGLEMLVGFHTAAVIHLDTGLFQAEAVGIWLATNGHQYDVGLDRLGIAALGRFNGHIDA